jgi:hypothetical protein
MPVRRIPPRNAKAPNAIWHYIQPGFERPIEGHSLLHLLKNIIAFRIDNTLDVGDPEKDVEDYIRSKWPHMAPVPREVPDSEIRKSPQRTLLDQIRATNKRWSFNPDHIGLVDAATADARAKICSQCGENVKINSVTSCAPCVSDLDRTNVILTNNHQTESKVQYCKSLHHDNRTAAWMPKERLEHSLKRVEQAPSHCWLNKL